MNYTFVYSKLKKRYSYFPKLYHANNMLFSGTVLTNRMLFSEIVLAYKNLLFSRPQHKVPVRSC